MRPEWRLLQLRMMLWGLCAIGFSSVGKSIPITGITHKVLVEIASLIIILTVTAQFESVVSGNIDVEEIENIVQQVIVSLALVGLLGVSSAGMDLIKI